jgi:hypothetical protein
MMDYKGGWYQHRELSNVIYILCKLGAIDQNILTLLTGRKLEYKK